MNKKSIVVGAITLGVISLANSSNLTPQSKSMEYNLEANCGNHQNDKTKEASCGAHKKDTVKTESKVKKTDTIKAEGKCGSHNTGKTKSKASKKQKKSKS